MWIKSVTAPFAPALDNVQLCVQHLQVADFCWFPLLWKTVALVESSLVWQAVRLNIMAKVKISESVFFISISIFISQYPLKCTNNIHFHEICGLYQFPQMRSRHM